MTESVIVNTSDANFEKDVIQSELPVLVDFWAPWCGPCRSLGPILEEVAQDYAGKLKVVKLDVEANHTIAAQLGIRNIPFLKIFKQAQEVGSQVGALSKQQLEAFIESSLK